MNKIILGQQAPAAPSTLGEISADQIASVAVTSEASDTPVENLFDKRATVGWRAGSPGTQIIRLTFKTPLNIRRVQLVFSEHSRERTQEFALSWSSGELDALHEIVRQRWNFSPNGSRREHEDYKLELSEVVVMELEITPDVSRAEAFASLDEWKLA